MSERDGFPDGVPCWVESLQPDPKAGVAFYEELFGWTFEGSGPIDGDPSREYFVARLRGADVAGVAPTPPDRDFAEGSWVTQVQSDDPEATGERAERAGGKILAGPMDFGEIGKLVVISDPQGGVLALWKGGIRAGAQVVNESNAWAMSSLTTPDAEGAAKFYGEVFGWTTETFGEGPGAATMFRLPGFVGGEPEQPVSREVVAVMTAGEEPGAVWTPDFWVDDVGDSVARVNELGGQAIAGPLETPMGEMAVIRDPQGATFTLSTLTVVKEAREAA